MSAPLEPPVVWCTVVSPPPFRTRGRLIPALLCACSDRPAWKFRSKESGEGSIDTPPFRQYQHVKHCAMSYASVVAGSLGKQAAAAKAAQRDADSARGKAGSQAALEAAARLAITSREEQNARVVAYL